MQIIIPMAGQGSRFKSVGIDTPKPLIVVDGETLAEHSIKTLGIDGKFIFITRTFENQEDNLKLTEIFNRTCKDFIEIRIDEKHLGAAHSALFAEGVLDINDELIITNSDQHLEWDGAAFKKFVDSNTYADGSVVLYSSTNPKNSFALLGPGHHISAIAEKQPISSDALIGVHYWRYAGDFIASAKRLVSDYKELGYPEAYVSTTYNYLINDKKVILGYIIDNNEYQSLGTPEDLKEYYEYRTRD